MIKYVKQFVSRITTHLSKPLFETRKRSRPAVESFGLNIHQPEEDFMWRTNPAPSIKDNCPCGAKFETYHPGVSAQQEHREWLQAHKVCREAYAKAQQKSNDKNDE